MRESIGGAWLLGLMVTFILFFTSFIIVTINYTRAFRIKNEMLSIIEKFDGLTSSTTTREGSISVISNFLIRNNQKSTGSCEEGELGAFSLEGPVTFEIVLDKRAEYYYCVSKHNKFDPNEPNKAYYRVTVFFDFNIPVFGELFKFSVNGPTKNVQRPQDVLLWGY